MSTITSETDLAELRAVSVEDEQLARTYAQALLNVAEERGRAEEVLEELDILFPERAAADSWLRQFMASEVLPKSHREAVIRKACEGRVSGLLLDFLLMMNQNDRVGLNRAIAPAYRYLMDEREGRVRVRVRSAVPLTAAQTAKLTADLKKSLGKEPVLHAAVEPDLLGGVVVQVGDRLYDGSLRTRLTTIRNQLLASSTHAIQRQRDRFSTDV